MILRDFYLASMGLGEAGEAQAVGTPIAMLLYSTAAAAASALRGRSH